MAWAKVILSESVARFSLFYKQIGAFWFVKSKAVNFSFQDQILTDPYVTSRDLQLRKPH